MFWGHALVGTLKAARDRGVVSYVGDRLAAGETDSTVITLLKDDVDDATVDTCACLIDSVLLTVLPVACPLGSASMSLTIPCLGSILRCISSPDDRSRRALSFSLSLPLCLYFSLLVSLFLSLFCLCLRFSSPLTPPHLVSHPFTSFQPPPLPFPPVA